MERIEEFDLEPLGTDPIVGDMVAHVYTNGSMPWGPAEVTEVHSAAVILKKTEGLRHSSASLSCFYENKSSNAAFTTGYNRVLKRTGSKAIDNHDWQTAYDKNRDEIFRQLFK